jgi:cardiolipin synthase C
LGGQVTFIILSFLGLVVVLMLAMRIWYCPPDQLEQQHSKALPPSMDGALHKSLNVSGVTTPGRSAIHVMDDAPEAFAMRRDLIRMAESSIDAQYYMWRSDITGRLLMADMLQAADRNVRVRILLDDNTTAGTDTWLLALNSHKNIEVRLFNPFMLRKPRAPSYLFDFRRLNRRMHNKSLTVDGIATIVGGRNIGDEYFHARNDFGFVDLDVLAVGEVVTDVVNSFDDYWNCASSFPLQSIVSAGNMSEIEQLQQHLTDVLSQDDVKNYLVAIGDLATGERIKQVQFETVPVQLFVDDPAKGQGDIPRQKLLVSGLTRCLDKATTSIDVLTAYFVPGRIGTKYLGRSVKSGKSVRILTNSLASNDVVAVHAGYARYRKRMLRLGIKLHELRSTGLGTPRLSKSKKKLPRFGASNSSLHAKIFIIDNRQVFVGSFNFDPRSVYLNCEMGLMIDSSRLGQRISKQMDYLVDAHTYTPFIDFGARLSWRDSQQKLFRMEPESTFQQRTGAWVVSWLPVEWLL